jgi:lysophospholipase L1-like esterase
VGRWGGRLLLAVGGVLALAIALEGLARLLAPPSPFFLVPGSGNCLRRDPSLSLSFVPDCHGLWHGTEFSTNALGLRGSQPAGDGRRRIIALGDSCTWGWQVAQDATFPALLQDMLARRGGRPVEVLNAAVPGWTSYQGLTWLRERGLALRPSALIVGFGFNDMTRNGDIEQRIASEREHGWLLRSDDALLNVSHLYRWLRGIGQTTGVAEAVPGADAVVSSERAPRVPPDGTEKNLTEIIRLARAQGAQVVMIDFLNPNGAEAPPYSAVIRRVAAATDTPLILYEGGRLDAVHPTSTGLRVFAGALADALR